MNKNRLKICATLFNHYAMEEYSGMEVKPHAVYTLVLVSDEW
jgi:hypothetical protein